MRKIIACLFSLMCLVLSTAAFAQVTDKNPAAASSNGGCPPNTSCTWELDQCLKDSAEQSKAHESILGELEKCRSEAKARAKSTAPKPPAPPVKPPVPVSYTCVYPAYAEGGSCSCPKEIEVPVDGEMVKRTVNAVRYVDTAKHTVTCGPDLAFIRTIYEDLAKRKADLPVDWRNYIDFVKIYIDGNKSYNPQDRDQMLRGHTSITQWLGDLDGKVKKIDSTVNAFKSVYCPEIPGKPDATDEEKCKYGRETIVVDVEKRVQRSLIEVEPFVEPRLGWKPGAGVNVTGTVGANVVIKPGRGGVGFIVGGYGGAVSDRDTSPLTVAGVQTGVRIDLEDKGRVTLDLTGNYERFTLLGHPAGWNGTQESTMGNFIGGRAVVNICFSEGSSFCLAPGGYLGGGSINTLPGHNRVEVHSGVIGGFVLGLKYRWSVY